MRSEIQAAEDTNYYMWHLMYLF